LATIRQLKQEEQTEEREKYQVLPTVSTFTSPGTKRPKALVGQKNASIELQAPIVFGVQLSQMITITQGSYKR